MRLPSRRVAPSDEGIIRAIASFCMTQCAIFCSMYCSVMPLNIARLGSAWKKHAEMPIFNMGMERTMTCAGSDRLGEDVFEIRARAWPRVGLMTDVVDGDVDQRRNIGARHRTLVL